MSRAGEKRYRYGDEFADIVQASQPVRKWYDIDIRSRLTPTNFYVLASVLSFLLLIVFGGLSISLYDACSVVQASGRCCECLGNQESGVAQFVQSVTPSTLPRTRCFNNIFYGVLIIISACFGLGYVYLGISQENRFLLFCMAATQATEVLRGVLDVALEHKSYSPMRTVRMAVLAAAGTAMIVSWLLLRRVYKLFGWRIFRQGGAKRVVRDMYKTYQCYRAFNLLDVQASVLSFLLLVFFVQSARSGWYLVFLATFLCEFTASRYMVKYLKREDLPGVLLASACKFVAPAWWTVLLSQYVSCYSSFEQSRRTTQSWWTAPYFPLLSSVAEYYGGQHCLPSHTVYDARILELMIINYTFAMFFRIASLVVAARVCQNFGKGLKAVFYTSQRQTNYVSEFGVESDYVAARGIHEEDLVGEYSDEETQPQDIWNDKTKRLMDE